MPCRTSCREKFPGGPAVPDKVRQVTPNVSNHPVVSLVTPGGDRGTEPGDLLSVLCVSEDPIFRKQIRRHLEQDGEMFVEISESAEDALHLMHYLRFEAIVTDSLTLGAVPVGFLAGIRKMGSAIPFICLLRTLDTGIPRAEMRSGRNRFLLWNGLPASPVFEKLAQIIREMNTRMPESDCRGVSWQAGLFTGPVV